MASLDKFLEWFHSSYNADYDKILKVFKRTRNFLKLVVNRNMQDQVDVGYIPNSEFKNDPGLFDFIAENGFLNEDDYKNIDNSLQNYYLLWLIEKDTNNGLKFICDKVFSDVEIRSDGYWLRLHGREELAEFYEKGSSRRDYSPRDIAEQIFSEEGLDYGRFWDTTHDVYSDVIDILDESNINILSHYIIKQIGNQEMSLEDYDSELFHDFSTKQGTEGFFKITSENVLELIKNEEAMKELFGGDLADLKSELYSIHSNAYNSAYESEVYDSVMGGLSEYFSSRIFEEEKKIGEKTRHIPYIKISNFYDNVMTFLNEYKGYTDTLDYFGNYTEMMKQLFNDGSYEAIDFRIPDYPDFTLVDKYINEFFPDYI